MGSFKLFLFGLDHAGKTTIVKLVKDEKDIETSPTLSFELSRWIIKDTEFQVWDAPGQIKFRGIWRKGFNKAKLLFFVLDTSDADRFMEAKSEFDKVINDLETRGIPLFFCYHKMDLPISKENYNKARGIFKLPGVSQEGERPLYQFKTSINDPESIDILKKTLVDVVQDSRW